MIDFYIIVPIKPDGTAITRSSAGPYDYSFSTKVYCFDNAGAARRRRTLLRNKYKGKLDFQILHTQLLSMVGRPPIVMSTGWLNVS